MKQEIMRLLKWDELEYTTFQFETGREYLRIYISGDEWAIAALERSRIFWNWWKNHWAQRDMQFVHDCAQNAHDAHKYIRVQDARRYYILVHNVKRLIGTIYPNGAVLSESYAKMIDEFNREVLHG